MARPLVRDLTKRGKLRTLGLRAAPMLSLAQVLCGVLEGIIPGYYSVDMPSLRVDLKALEEVSCAPRECVLNS